MRDDFAEKQTDFNTVLLGIDPHEEWSAKFLLKETGLSSKNARYLLLVE